MSSLSLLMKAPLPGITYQRRNQFKPSMSQVHDTFHALNNEIFDNSLLLPDIELARMRTNYGECSGYDEPNELSVGLRLKDRFHCIQWFIVILAHEMVHQYQWTVEGAERRLAGKDPLLSHGPSFFAFKPKLERVGIPLKIRYDSDKWLKTQMIHWI